MEMTLDKDIANLSLASNELLEDTLSMDDNNNNDKNASRGSSSHEGEEEPTVGMIFDSLDDTWAFWRKYGKRMGFSVRKEQSYKSPKEGCVTIAYYVCSKEGRKKIDKRRNDSLHRWETRTGCMVKLSVGYDRDIKKYKIRKFVKDHNHLLETTETSHMLRSNREVTEAHGCAIDVACSAGLAPTVAYELMVIEAGGRHNVGYVLEDHKSYLQTRRQNKMKYGELGCIMNYFEQKKLEWPSFYHSEQRDADEMTTNIFWCDSKMQTDYDAFGDVITFDTTFGTNKEFRPLGAFVGFNNHRQMIIFGAALMYDEMIDSFKWLFQTFINAHKQKRPLTIFTDQDAAMMNALQQVLPETHHGLCTWHITKNAKKHMGSYMKEGENGYSFWRTFQKCMYEIMDEMEFEVTWSQMLKEFKLQENSWLNGIYLLKLMWARCYMKKFFTLGIRSTQISESFNSNMKAHLKCDINLAEFFTQFDRVVERIRENKLEAEFSARQKVPSIACPGNPLLREAASVYTPAIFKKFQEEFLAANELYIKQTSGLIEGEFVLGAYGNNPREYKVFYDGNRAVANCSCKR